MWVRVLPTAQIVLKRCRNMLLRIIRRVTADESVIVLHGWLRAVDVTEFENAVALDGSPVRIDLEQLAGADIEGLRSLLRQEERGAHLTGASPYIELLLSRTAGSEGIEP
jgi:hypothetical protein